MIPWTVSTQYNDSEFATLSGARIVRIATHPDVQKMGCGEKHTLISCLNPFIEQHFCPNCLFSFHFSFFILVFVIILILNFITVLIALLLILVLFIILSRIEATANEQWIC